MIDVEKCRIYFEEEIPERRIFRRFCFISKNVLREFLYALGYIEYELVTTFGHECSSVH